MKSFSSSLSSSIIFAIVAIIVTLGQAQAFQTGKRRAPSENRNSGDMMLPGNKHIIPYTANDLKSVSSLGSYCPKVPQSDNTGDCMTFTSASTNTTWKIRFAQNGRAESVFKVQSNKIVNWVYFEANGDVVYLSEAARQQYAGVERQKVRGIAIARPQSGTAILECDYAYVVRHGARECSDRRKDISGVVEPSRRETPNSPNIGTLLGIGNAIGGILQQGR